MRRRQSLSLAFALVCLLALPIIACNSSEAIQPPFDNILPQHVDSAPNLWFEDTGVEGTFYTENKVIQHYERTFKGDNVKFWSNILVFANDESAHRFVEKQSSWNIYTSKHYNDLPSSVKHVPDQSMVWMIETEATFREWDEPENGALSYGVYFRVDRYVGDYSVTYLSPNFSSYAFYLEGYGSPSGFTCWMELLEAVDEGIRGLQALAGYTSIIQ